MDRLPKAREQMYAVIVRKGENDEETCFVDLTDDKIPFLYIKKADAKSACEDITDSEVISVMIVPTI